MLEKVLYGIFLFFVKFMQILPKKLRRGFFFILSRFLYIFARKTNKIIETNLNFVYDNKLSNDEIQKIQKYSYFNMSLWILSLIENIKISDEEVNKSVVIENKEVIDRLKKEGKPIIFISAHFGNMDMLGCYMGKFVTPMVQVTRESNFSLIDNFIVKSRESSGLKVVFKSGAVKKLVRAVLKKEDISLIIDQNINNIDGTEVNFLGKTVNQSSTAANLSRKFDAVVVPAAIFNQDDYKYKIKIYDPIYSIKTEDEESDIKEMSQLHADALSNIINEDPKQWFWPHKRFKSHYREIYDLS